MRLAVLLVMSFLAMPALAEERFVTTKGEAKVEVPPDFIEIDMTLLAIGPELQRLKDDVDTRTRQVLAAASELHIAGTDIESSGISVTREYESDRNSNEQLRGYRVTRGLQVKLRKIDDYEQLTKALVAAKVDEIDSVEVDVDDRSALKQRALAAAARNAKNEALAIATELGLQLGLPLEVSEERLIYRHELREKTDERYQEIVVTAQQRDSATPATVVFQPHAIEMQATVWARFEILSRASP